MTGKTLTIAASIAEQGGVRNDIPELNRTAVRALVSLFDKEQRLFSRRVVLTKQGFRRDRISKRRTIIALLGLQRLAQAGGECGLDLPSVQGAIFSDVSWVEGIGDLGLLTWLAATSAPEQLDVLFGQFDFSAALKSYPDARQACTRELAWFLAGLSHAQLVIPPGSLDLTDLGVETYHRLENNQGEDGLFSHLGSPNNLLGMFWKRFGTFSDQVYAIYALTKFGQAFQVEEPLAVAMDCANSICALQGEKGQWWFLYDKRRSRVVSRYPVLSVHQDGMAPAALLALEEAVGQSFQKPISKGLGWVIGMNELGDDLRTMNGALIWDSISPGAPRAKYWKSALNILGIPCDTSEKDLRIRYEARADHFGWLLYAFGKFGLPGKALAARAARAR